MAALPGLRNHNAGTACKKARLRGLFYLLNNGLHSLYKSFSEL